MTKLKLSETEPEEVVALLQRRGKINTDNEYGFKNQSLIGLCEVTSYGKAEPGETAEQALKREMIEELGHKATETIFNNKPVELYINTEYDGDQMYVWACLADRKILKEIKLDISTGGIEILRKSDLDKARFTVFKDKGLAEKNLDNVVIYEVPKAAFEKAFSLF